MFYGFQMAMEIIHSETYSLLIEQYIRGPHHEWSHEASFDMRDQCNELHKGSSWDPTAVCSLRSTSSAMIP